VDGVKRIRAWFFEQDGGWYVQCKYGSRVLHINGKSNAVFVDKLEGVADVLKAFKNAAETGELDKAIIELSNAKKK
jgi:nitric oxide synthase oxygenase domain/subunit